MIKKMFFLLALMSTLMSYAETHVLLFSGSLRKDSLNKKLVKEAAAIAEKLGAQVEWIELNDYPIPFYNGDDENASGLPENARKIRNLMIESQVIMIASPNYNRSYPAVVKNLLDWASRSENAEESYEAFQGKTFGLMSAGPGKSGGVKGLEPLHHLLQTLKGNVLSEQFVLPYGNVAFNSEGHLINSETEMQLENFVKKALGQ